MKFIAHLIIADAIILVAATSLALALSAPAWVVCISGVLSCLAVNGLVGLTIGVAGLVCGLRWNKQWRTVHGPRTYDPSRPKAL